MYDFPIDYFRDEYREGFLVDSMVKRAWAAQLEVLGHVVRICEKYGLTYWGMWGTLLGAVRHKGYVPWDDDLDIAMRREDYDRFLEVAASELPQGYVVMSPYTEPEWQEQLARVTNSHSINFSDTFLDEYHGFPYSTGVDIFPYDYVPNDESQQREQAYLISIVVETRNNVIRRNDLTAVGDYDGQYDTAIDNGLCQLENSFGFEFNRELYLDNQLLCLYDQLSAIYGDKSSKYMTCLAERTKRQARNSDFIVPAYLLGEVIDYKFEEFTIKIPKYYEIILSICYGKSFMIPIKHGVAGHDYPFFKVQAEVLKDIGRFDEVMQAVYRADNRNGRREKDSVDDIYIANSGNYRLNSVNTGKDLLDSLKMDNRRCILICFSTMDFYNQEEAVLRKMKQVFDLMKSHKNDVATVFMEASYVADILEKKDSTLVEKYHEIIDNYIAEGWGYHIADDSFEYVAEYCDAYYGSGNEYIKYFTDNKKPVMILNANI